MPLNTEQLEAFWYVVQTGSYHRAAEALFITQSAVTQRIKALEGSLGHKLFIRSGRGVTLTEAGQLLSRYCREQREAELMFIHRLNGEPGSFVGRLAVAAGSSEGCTWLLPVLARLGRQHPELNLALTIDDAMDPIALLEGNKVDVVLGETPLRRRGLRSIRVGMVPYSLAVSPLLGAAWPERPDAEQLKQVRAVDFSPSDQLTLDLLASCLPREDFSDLRRYFVNSMHGLIEWVLAGGGYSALPLPLIRQPLKEGKLRLLFPEVRYERPLYLSLAEGSATPVHQLLQARLMEMLAP